ncbi:MAG: transcriptional repressor NrdR [Spirochaetales bacterium]|nr:transcriptional repressor NrdR [Spirochaetales bacterium]
MKCPHCNELEDKVIQSRQNAIGTTIKRRRECLNCGYRFTSYEKIENKPLMVIKKDNSREPFSREKLAKGLRVAIRKRSISESSFEELLNTIEDIAEMEARDIGEIKASRLGEMVLDNLYKIDKVAYIRFASVYRMYKDVDEFIKEIEKLTSKKN